MAKRGSPNGLKIVRVKFKAEVEGEWEVQVPGVMPDEVIRTAAWPMLEEAIRLFVERDHQLPHPHVLFEVELLGTCEPEITPFEGREDEAR